MNDALEGYKTPRRSRLNDDSSSPLSELSPSPRKRPRTEPSSPTTQHDVIPTATSPLLHLKVTSSPRTEDSNEPSPTDGVLFYLAQTSLEQASNLLHRLSRVPAKTETSSPAYVQTVIDYRRLVAFAITSLRSVVSLAEGVIDSDVIVQPDVELSSRALLAELLMRELENGQFEAEQVLARGIIVAQRHARLADLKYRLCALQVECMIKAGDIKLARTSVRRHIVDISSNSGEDTTSMHWLCHFHMLNIQLSPEPSAVHDLISLASARGSHSLFFAAKLIACHSAMLMGDADDARRHLEDLAKPLGLPMTSKGAAKVDGTSGIPQALVLQAHVLYGFYHAQFSGQAELARNAMKRLHALLDTSSLAEDEADWLQLEHGVIVRLLPRHRLYSAMFLFSALIGRDPSCKYLRDPLLFHDAGLAHFDQRWRDSGEFVGRYGGIEAMHEDKRETRCLEIDIQLSRAEMLICRSSFEDAKTALDRLVVLVEGHSLWQRFGARIALVAAQLFQAVGLPDRATSYYRATARLAPPDGLLQRFADVCQLFARVGQGVPVRREGDIARRRPPSPKRGGLAVEDTYPDIHTLGSMAIDLVKRLPDTSVPSFQMLADMVDAVATPTPSSGAARAKRHLTAALANASHDVPSRALIMSLLAAHYLHTFGDQATKMLISALSLARSLGASKPPKEKGTPLEDRHAVGHPGLGLWLAEQLLRHYERGGNEAKLEKQKILVESHRRVIEKRDAFASALS